MKTIFYNTTTAKLGKSRATPYTVDGQPGILPDNIIELEVIEAERPVISEMETAAMEWVIDLPMNQYRQEWTIRDLTDEEIRATYSRITRLQGMLLCVQLNYYDTVVEQMKLAPIATQIAFENAVTWEIGNSLITEFAAMLGLSDEEVDEFFKTASQIEIE